MPPVTSTTRFVSFFLTFLFCYSEAWTQTDQITGVVRDANSYREVGGVNILILGTQSGTICNAAGRYTLQIPAGLAQGRAVFRHVSYFQLEVSLDSLRRHPEVRLQPRLINVPGMEVIGQGEKPSYELSRELPQAVTLLDAKNFELRGYADAGDYLRTDAAIQVEEEMSGRKTLSIRGGNSDDVVVLYNGVKMNNLVDHTFDFSLIDLDRLQRFEIIRGGNTVLYGPEAFSGVINIVPQSSEKYFAQAQYRMGTYNTENISVNLNKTLRRWSASYGYKTGQNTRYFAGSPKDQNLQNDAEHHTFDLQYQSPASRPDESANTLHLTLLRSDLTFDNTRDAETVDNLQELAALRYQGAIAGINDLNLLASFRRSNEGQGLHFASSLFDRSAQDDQLSLEAAKGFHLGGIKWLAGYQYNQTLLDLLDNRQEDSQPYSLQDADLTRQHHGLVAIATIEAPTGSNFFRTFELNISARQDNLHDLHDSRTDLYIAGKKGATVVSSDQHETKDWQATSLKMAVSLNGYSGRSYFSSYLSYGSNSKFPTLLQMMSSPLLLKLGGEPIDLKAEKIRSLELGAEMRREIEDNVLSGWEASANYFQNYYDNKFRAYTTPGIPITFYDNVPTAQISGAEGKYAVLFFRNKVRTELSLADLSISEKAAFPFKSDFKMTLQLSVDHAGYFFNILAFHESDQIGWMRTQTGDFMEVTLPSQFNLDAHIGKMLQLKPVSLFINFSGRNLLNADKVLLQGLSLRDKRYYISVGLQIHSMRIVME